MRTTSLIKQPFTLIILQFILLLGLFWGRYTLHPSSVEVKILAQVKEGALEGIGGNENVWEFFCRAISSQSAMPIETLVNTFVVNFPLIASIFVVLIIALNAVLITRAMVRNMATPARNYLPAIIYLIVSCGVIFPGASLSSVLSATAIVLFMLSLISSYGQKRNFDSTFRSGILLGIAFTLHIPSLIFILLIPISTWLFRRSGREALITTIGAILPVMVFAYLIWAIGGEFSELFIRSWKLLNSSDLLLTEMLPIDPIKITTIGLIGVLVLMSLGTYVVNGADLRTGAYKIYGLSIWFLLLILIGGFLPFSSPTQTSIVAIPLSILITLYFSKHSGRIPLILYTITLLFVVLLNVIPFF